MDTVSGIAEPQPWPVRRAGVAALAGAILPFALLPWAGGLLLYPYFLAAPAVVAALLAPRGMDRDGYQVLGIAAALAGAVVAAGWNFLREAGDVSAWGNAAGAAIIFLLFAIVPVLGVLLTSNRYPKRGVGRS